MNVQVFTSVVNRPDFVEIQHKLFKKFMKDDYQFHVVDDSPNEELAEEFKRICEKNSIVYYRKPQDPNKNKESLGRSNIHASITYKWTFDEILLKKYSNDLILFLDSDMFLIDDFSIVDYMKDCIISGLPQTRGKVKYMWNGIMFFNMKKICEIDTDLDFSDGQVEGELTDTNGHLYYYFKRNNISFKETNVEYPETYNDINLEEVCGGINFELHLNNKFLHYRAGTNWHTQSKWKSKEDPLKLKIKIFNQIIKDFLD